MQVQIMSLYILKRLGSSMLVLFGVLIIVFALTQMQPTDPFSGIVDAQTNMEVIEKKLQDMGYYDPIPIQFLNWAKLMLKGDLGTSIHYHQPVFDLICARFINTLILSSIAFFIGSFAAIAFGILAAYKLSSVFDKSMMSISFAIISIPTFFVCLILLKIFSYDLMIFPASGIYSVRNNYEGIELFLIYSDICSCPCWFWLLLNFQLFSVMLVPQ